MKRYGVRPSNDARWERMAEEVIARAERERVPLAEFYAGLASIMDSLDMRLSGALDELEPEDD